MVVHFKVQPPNPAGAPLGDRNGAWSGGRHLNPKGYVMVLARDHPNNVRGYVMEHRLVMEAVLGRLLTREEVVHHLNGVRADNRRENLELVASHTEHMRAHHLGHGWADPSFKR